MTIILGLDPSLSCTGWGVIRAEGSRLSHIANGQIATDAKAPIPERLAQLQRELSAVIAQHAPERAACEEVFVNKNPQSTLKLAQARGAVLAACGAAGLAVREHAARSVKKAAQFNTAACTAQNITAWPHVLVNKNLTFDIVPILPTLCAAYKGEPPATDRPHPRSTGDSGHGE